MPIPSDPADPLADLLAHCIIVFERDGQPAVDELLTRHPQLALVARAQMQTLLAAGMLIEAKRPERIGRYRVRKWLGAGGMGSVWLCEQDEPIHRRVAVKLIRPGMNQGDVLRRFHIEQQTLALLEHPNIARVLDAGATDDGQPFLVMEYVPGLALGRYCDQRQLDLRARLQLFLQVCDAVQHAHQKGILHRDLKASNVLVTDRDGAPFPVVIDFGVAKSIGVGVVAGTMLTLPGRLIGTPEYMSPEQATNEHDLDTRTDVYSLGVVLYELLTGTLPIASATLQRSSDLARVLREVEPPTPSTRLTSLGDELLRIAENRRTDPQTLRRHLKGDLDWIVLKALEKDRNRRYGMVGELAADVRRHLADQPVQAARPSSWYLATKFWRRHRLEVAAGASIFVVLAAGLVTSTIFYRDASAAELDARGLATRLHGSLDTTLAAVDRIVALGADGLQALPQSGQLRAELLEQALALHERLIASGDGNDPRLAASLASALARAATLQFMLGRRDAALELLARAERTLASSALAADLDESARCQVARALFLCGELRNHRGEPGPSRAHTERSLAIYDEVLLSTPDRRDARTGRLQALRALADRATATDVERARTLLRAAVPLAERFLNESGASRDELRASLHVWLRLGWLEGETGNLTEGLHLTRRAHERMHRILAAATEPVERLEFARLLPTLANSELRFGDWDPARRSALLAVEELRKAVAAHPEMDSYRAELAEALFLLAILEGDRRPHEVIEGWKREALQLEGECFVRSGHNPERGDRFIGKLIGYIADHLDQAGSKPTALDRPLLEQLLAKAEAIRAALPTHFLSDRHTRESWLQYYVVRAGLLRHDGRLPDALAMLAAGSLAAKALQDDHPEVVQGHRLAAEIAFEQSRLQQQLGDHEAEWHSVLRMHSHLRTALQVDRQHDQHWRRARSFLLHVARTVALAHLPDAIEGEAIAMLASDFAACASSVGTCSTSEAAELLAFGRTLFAAAPARGLSTARSSAAEFAILRER